MAEVPYKVRIVVDRDFAEGLVHLETGIPVWVVDTPANRIAVQRLRQASEPANHLTGITTFADSNSASPDELLISQLDAIDLHHGPLSADPPYTILEVFGTELTERAKTALSAYGFGDFRTTPGGFSALRPVMIRP